MRIFITQTIGRNYIAGTEISIRTRILNQLVEEYGSGWFQAREATPRKKAMIDTLAPEDQTRRKKMLDDIRKNRPKRINAVVDRLAKLNALRAEGLTVAQANAVLDKKKAEPETAEA